MTESISQLRLGDLPGISKILPSILALGRKCNESPFASKLCYRKHGSRMGIAVDTAVNPLNISAEVCCRLCDQ
jgi:hypothetical protein